MAENIVILTGAGISKESGLDTFRDNEGLWQKYDVMQLATPEAFAANPQLVHQFYNSRRRGLLSAAVTPNAAHEALARLEREWPDVSGGGRVLIVTQNVDDLHERAGTRNIIHMHGELLKSLCNHCGDVRECRDDLTVETACGACGQVGGVRPCVVWFGEIPFHMGEIEDALLDCSYFLSVGTSGTVYPAAGFVRLAAQSGATTVELNLETSDVSHLFDEVRSGPATKNVPEYIDYILKARSIL